MTVALPMSIGPQCASPACVSVCVCACFCARSRAELTSGPLRYEQKRSKRKAANLAAGHTRASATRRRRIVPHFPKKSRVYVECNPGLWCYLLQVYMDVLFGSRSNCTPLSLGPLSREGLLTSQPRPVKAVAMLKRQVAYMGTYWVRFLY